MRYEEIVDLMNTDPVVQALLQAPIPARLAYVATDDSPRAIPISYLWNGKALVMCSPTKAPKIRALTANPKVALTVDTTVFPPNILLVRGVASIHVEQGIPTEYIEASRRIVGEELMENWERIVREQMTEMAVITVTPTWIKIIDFITRFPGPVDPAQVAGS